MTRLAAVTYLIVFVLGTLACDKSSTSAAAGSDASSEAPEPDLELEPGLQAEPAPPSPDEQPTLVAAAVDASSFLATAEDAAEPVEEEPIDEEPAAPREYELLIIGDSLIATGFGALLEKRLDAHPQITAYRRGKSASGLARPDFFDWMAEAKRQVELRKPDMVIVLMGGNDGQDLTPKVKRKGKRVPWQHEDWEAAYRQRVETLLAEVSAPEREILWLGMPTMGLRSLEKKLVMIRGAQQAAVDAHASATYLETASLVSDEEGNMLTHAEVGPKKRRQSIRADDRIHFTMAGSQYFADAIYPKILEVLEVEDATPAEE